MITDAPRTTPSGARTFAVREGALLRRSDPRHLRLSWQISRDFSSPRYPLRPLGDVLSGKITYGTSNGLVAEPPGFPVLRMSNLTLDGWDLGDVKHLDCGPDVADHLLLRPGDILINRTNSDELVGKAGVFDLEGDWIYASYLLRIRLDPTKADPASSPIS